MTTTVETFTDRIHEERTTFTDDEVEIVRTALTAHATKRHAAREVQTTLGLSYAQAARMVDAVMYESETGDINA